MSKVKTEYFGNRTSTEEKQQYRWWRTTNNIHESVFSVVNHIEKQSNFQQTLNIRHARLYSDLELLGFASFRLAKSNSASNLTTNRLTYNVIRSVINTAASKIAKNKPKPQFLTDKGNWNQQEKAKQLTKYVEGVFYDTDIYTEAQKVFIDACVFGTGALKFYTSEGRIKVERVFIDEIRVDYVDGAQSKPKQIHQVKYMNRDLLTEMYPEHIAAIYDAASGLEAGSESIDDVVKVIESWHLPTTKDSGDGKHTICIDNATLFEEEYTKSFFPFTFFRWSQRVSGFFGYGVAEELTGLQLSINKTLMNIQKAQHLIAVPRIFVDSSAKVSTQHLNNDIGSIVKYAGGSRPPVFNTPTAMNPEVYNHLRWMIQSAYELTGISMLSAQSRKPAGLDSGVALREYSDIETERFMLTGMRFEQMFLDAAKIIINLSRDLYSDNKDLVVTVPGGSFIETVKWKSVDLRDDQFIMKLFPTSILPSTPAGRLQKVQELIQAGFIPQEQGLALLDFPDLGAYESLETSNSNLIRKVLTDMVEIGEYSPPEPQMDLKQAIQYAHKSYLRGRTTNITEDRLELLLRFIDDCERMLNIKEQAPGTSIPNTVAEPTATPESPEQSELIPNTPQV